MERFWFEVHYSETWALNYKPKSRRNIRHTSAKRVVNIMTHNSQNQPLRLCQCEIDTNLLCDCYCFTYGAGFAEAKLQVTHRHANYGNMKSLPCTLKFIRFSDRLSKRKHISCQVSAENTVISIKIHKT